MAHPISLKVEPTRRARMEGMLHMLGWKNILRGMQHMVREAFVATDFQKTALMEQLTYPKMVTLLLQDCKIILLPTTFL